MSFLYPFLNFLQPGILFPDLAELRPMLIISLLAIALGLLGKAEVPRMAGFRHPTFLWLMTFLFMQVISVHGSGMLAMFEYFMFWSAYMLFVIASLTVITSPQALRRYVAGMLAGCMFVVAYGIYGVFAWGGYQWQGETATGRAGAYGMYENHNDYSFIIIQILPFTFMYLKSEKGLVRRALLAGALLACVVGIFMSLSRGGVLAMLLEFVLLLLLGIKSRKRFLLLPVLIIAGAGAIIYQWTEREENQAGEYSATDAESSRFELWRAARQMIQDKPLLGVGSHRFYEFSQGYIEGMSQAQRGKNTHNTYLEILTGSGLLGFLPFVLAIWYLIKDLRRPTHNNGPPWLEATRVATLVSVYSILFRAFLDAKDFDWSFFVLPSIGIMCCALRRNVDTASAASARPPRYERYRGEGADPLPASLAKPR